MSTTTTSVPLAFADSSASWRTAAGSAPGDWQTISAPLRSAHSFNCSPAAARNVSPAASRTDNPLRLSQCDSFPIVVVLPVPLTPTTSMTNGLVAVSGTSGTSRGCNSSAARDRSLSRIVSSLDPGVPGAAKRSSNQLVASTPTSAVNNSVSSASRVSSSNPEPNKPARSSAIQALPLLRRLRRRLKKPGSVTALGAVDTVEPDNRD